MLLDSDSPYSGHLSDSWEIVPERTAVHRDISTAGLDHSGEGGDRGGLACSSREGGSSRGVW